MVLNDSRRQKKGAEHLRGEGGGLDAGVEMIEVVEEAGGKEEKGWWRGRVGCPGVKRGYEGVRKGRVV